MAHARIVNETYTTLLFRCVPIRTDIHPRTIAAVPCLIVLENATAHMSSQTTKVPSKTKVMKPAMYPALGATVEIRSPTNASSSEIDTMELQAVLHLVGRGEPDVARMDTPKNGTMGQRNVNNGRVNLKRSDSAATTLVCGLTTDQQWAKCTPRTIVIGDEGHQHEGST